MRKFRIRASHLKRGAFGIVCDNEPLEVNGNLARFDTLEQAYNECNRRAIALGQDCKAYRLDEMPQVYVYGWHHVLASSGAN